ncbi:hypothetical protein JKF63_02446 [Porcisia hertigi]|uniref:RRM domain-containing protein n=1 Tax=Porcisia hertigi TaxID=2761500 RepID=A0A836L679_9TRYP|nr:hypothetical protein JKF63_02446 [Porcisia hertigi]
MTTVVLSNLPMGCIESDIHRALLMYGTAINIEMNSHACQATVTMRTKQEAQALLSRRSVNVIGTSVRVDPQMQAPPPPQQLPLPQQHPMMPQPPQQQFQQPQMMGGYNYGVGNGAHQEQSMYGNVAPQQYPQQHPSHQSHQLQPYEQQQQSYPRLQQQIPSSLPQSIGSCMPIPSRVGGTGHAIMPTPPQSSPRLRVVVEDCRYPITRDVLMQMFSMIAPPVSVSCGPCGPTTTGVVEFAEVASAQQAMDQFHNNAIYPNCCYVKLYFEPVWDRYDPAQQPPQLNRPHSYNVGNSGCDYPAATQGPTNMPSSTHSSSYGVASSTTAQPGAYSPGWDRGDGARGCEGTTPASAPPSATPHSLHPHPPQLGQPTTDSQGRGRVDSDPCSDGAYDHGPATQRGAERDMTPKPMTRGGHGAIRGGLGGRGGGLGCGAAAGFSPYEPPSGATPPVRGGGCGSAVRYPGSGIDGCTVMVSGVTESVPLHDLWVLLEVFGNVNSLKRQFRDRTNVVAQFQHPGDALTAIQYLQHCPFRGGVLRLKRFSGYQERETEWETKAATDPATQAALFTTGYHHRTAPRAPVNVRGRVHPDKNLYISNLTEGISDDELKGIMKEAGFEPDSFYRRGPKGAIVAYKDTETAVDALIAIHAKEVRERFLRVTFSRFAPGPRPSRDGAEKGDGVGDGDDGEDAVGHGGDQENQPQAALQPQVTQPLQVDEKAAQPIAEPPAPPSHSEASPLEADGGEVASAAPEAAPKAPRAKPKASKK